MKNDYLLRHKAVCLDIFVYCCTSSPVCYAYWCSEIGKFNLLPRLFRISSDMLDCQRYCIFVIALKNAKANRIDARLTIDQSLYYQHCRRLCPCSCRSRRRVVRISIECTIVIKSRTIVKLLLTWRLSIRCQFKFSGSRSLLARRNPISVLQCAGFCCKIISLCVRNIKQICTCYRYVSACVLYLNWFFTFISSFMNISSSGLNL